MFSLFTISFLLLWLPAADGLLFPTICVKGVSQWPVVCCPLFKASYCGRALNRGDCLPVIISYSEPPADVIKDERDNFPSFFFNWTCQCKPRFMGYNCGECAPGWIGDNCDFEHTIYRQDIMSMSLREVELFKAIMNYAKTKTDPEYCILRSADRLRRRSYEFIEASYLDVVTFIHTYATRSLISNGQEIPFINFAHGGIAFLTWHRFFLFVTERQIQKCIKDEYFAMPYYRWEIDNDCAICNDDYLGASGYNGRISRYSVFSEWRVICALDYAQTVCMTEDCPCERPRLVRMPGFEEVYRPTEDDVDYCLSMPYVDTPPYDLSSENSFRNCMENLHNLKHIFFGGVMAQVSSSPNDPIFFLHHCNVDRIADIYYVRNGITSASYPPSSVYGHRPRDCITPFYNCTRNNEMMVPSYRMGIRYI